VPADLSTDSVHQPATVAVACCSPVTGQVLEPAQAELLAGALKAIADPTRLRLISMVAARDGGEACVCDLTQPVGLSQPTVSHHLKILVDAGVLAREQRGKWAYYRLIPGRLDTLARLIAAGVTTNDVTRANSPRCDRAVAGVRCAQTADLRWTVAIPARTRMPPTS